MEIVVPNGLEMVWTFSRIWRATSGDGVIGMPLRERGRDFASAGREVFLQNVNFTNPNNEKSVLPV